jgi:transcriptional regulator with XRE-family HTH domain
VEGVDNRSEIRDFLASRRARITPEQAGLPAYGVNRRVAGLRREEVAMLAGVSVDYYTRLERGNLSGASDSVLDALAEALQLDDAERTHLFDLARAAAPQRRRPTPNARVRPATLRVIDAMTNLPAYVRNGRFDILAANQLGRALYAPVFDSPLFASRGPVNTARFCFLDPTAKDFWVEWQKAADDSVAFLRLETGRSPQDRALTQLIGELTTRSREFAERWARHDVKYHRAGIKRLRHPLVGELSLPYEAMELSADAGLRLNVYAPEPDSPEQEALNLMASWVPRTVTFVP